MGVGTSIVLIAAGAILRYAVTASVSGISLHVVGLILMIVGAIGLVFSLLWLAGWAGTGGDRVVRREVIRDRDVY